jgi:hypothetical protein
VLLLAGVLLDDARTSLGQLGESANRQGGANGETIVIRMARLAIVLAFGGVIGVAESATASPVVLDFTILSHNDASMLTVGPVYEEEGFRLSASSFPGSGVPADFVSIGTLRWDYDGEPSIYNGQGQGGIELTQTDRRAVLSVRDPKPRGD